MPKKQFRLFTFSKYFCYVMFIAVAVLLAVVFQPWAYPTYFLDDPVQIANHFLKYHYAHPQTAPSYLKWPAGAMTYLCALVLCASGAVSLFTSMCLRNEHRDSPKSSFFFHGGILTFFLAFDDLFMLHELTNHIVHHGEFYMICIYLLYLIWITFKFRGLLLSYRLGPIVFSFLCLGLSIYFDTVGAHTQLHRVFSFERWDNHVIVPIFEEGFKWLGFSSWFCFFTYQSWHEMTKPEAGDIL